jgi:hypothetical protein
LVRGPVRHPIADEEITQDGGLRRQVDPWPGAVSVQSGFLNRNGSGEQEITVSR